MVPAECRSPSWWPFRRCGPLMTAARAMPRLFEELRLGVARRDRRRRRPVVAGGAPEVGAFFVRGDPQLPFPARLAAPGPLVLHLPVPDPTRARALPRLRSDRKAAAVVTRWVPLAGASFVSVACH